MSFIISIVLAIIHSTFSSVNNSLEGFAFYLLFTLSFSIKTHYIMWITLLARGLPVSKTLVCT